MAEIEKKKYKNNYLTQVVYQVIFDKINTFNEEDLKSYKQTLGEDYSELASIKQQGIIIENNGSQLQTRAEDSELWQIKSKDDTHVITITAQSFAIVYSKYTKFRDYIDIILNAQLLFFEHFKSIEQLNRVGLRYVNQISPPSLEKGWSQYIDSRLVSPLDFTDSSKLRRSMHTMNIEHDENTKINFNFGIFNEYFPSPIVKNEFILDLDAYTENLVKLTDCRSLIELFNKNLAIYFEQCITDDLRKQMEVIEDDENK